MPLNNGQPIQSIRASKSIGVLALLSLAMIALAFAPPVSAQTSSPSSTKEVGVRAASGDDFDSLDLYYRHSAPWLQSHLLGFASEHHWQALWDVTVAYWDGSESDNGFLAIGPVFEWQKPQQPWRVSLGVQPTLISSHNGNGKDLGGPFQFTSHLGVAWAPADALVLGLRVQHTSNASLYDENPGVDMVSTEVGFRF
jgi:hypothetical protein